MQIDEGLFSHMVLQRNKSNRSDAHFVGRCESAGVLEARVKLKGRIVPGWNWKAIGRAESGKMAGVIKGLLVGGPYDVELRIVGEKSREKSGGKPDVKEGGKAAAKMTGKAAVKPVAAIESISIKDVLVGDVWLLAGQSNMEGIGWLKDRLAAAPGVRAFYMNDEWATALDPLHTLWCAVDEVHGGNPSASRHEYKKHTGVGPGVAFGQDLFARSGVPQGLIACAHGGTSMAQWDPAKKNMGGRSLYGAMCRRIRKNGGAVAGMLWYQGCSDGSQAAAPLYTERMKKLIRAVRRDCGDSALPVVVVQISRVTRVGAGGEWWSSIRDQQRRLAGAMKNVLVVPGIDLPLDDTIHISGAGQQILGRRCAQAMSVLCKIKGAGKPPIDLRDLQVRPNPISGLADVVVRFKNVEGSLRAAGLPSGFALESASLANNHYRVDLHKDTAIVHLGCGMEMVNGALVYGQGFDPYCNITDEAGRAVPGFGPVPMKNTRPRAMTNFITRPRVSAIMAGVDISELKYPQDTKMEPRQFPAMFCDLHLALAEAGKALVFYAFTFRCAEAMKLNFELGYDGPVKAWMDRREIYCDPRGTNPARPDDAKIALNAAGGDHEIMVALGSGGAAWGVFLRLERKDVSLRVLRKAPQSVKMPELIG